eukprot:sb/3471407/
MWQSEREKETHREKPRKDSDAVLSHFCFMKRRCSKRQLRSTWSVSSDLDLILVDLGAIGTIRQQSEESVALARQRLEETRLQTAEDLSKLEEEYLQMEKKVNDKTNECEVLIKFKGTDKEYHMRVARLNELKVELENLVSEQKTERSELAALVSKHHSNLNLNITESGSSPKYPPIFEGPCPPE